MNTELDVVAQVPIYSPLTGEVVDMDDVDSIVDALEFSTDFRKRMDLFTTQLRLRLANLALAASEDKEAITQRVRGTRRIVKVTMPDIAFEQRALKDIVANYPPELREGIILVDSYKVAIREFKKLAAQSGPPQFLAFRDALNSACRGRVGTPSCSIEDDLALRRS